MNDVLYNFSMASDLPPMSSPILQGLIFLKGIKFLMTSMILFMKHC